MNKQEWNEGLNQIDDDIVEAYVEEKQKRRRRRALTFQLLKVGAIAAVVILVFSPLWNRLTKYQRISFDSETLGEDFAHHVNADTVVINTATDTFSNSFPVYKIAKRNITTSEYQQMCAQITVPTFTSPWHGWEHHGNRVSGRFADYATGTCTLSDEELEKLARETFGEIPFLEGEYEYYGIRGEDYISTSNGKIVTGKLVSFFRCMDGVRVIGDQCDMWFNDSGLIEINIVLYEYTKIGTMDLVKLEDALERVKTPDSFTLDTQKVGPGSVAETLQIDRINLRFANQYSRGCTILQPVYVFTGTATLKDKSQAEFGAKIIAIPEKYTYEKK